MSGRWLWQRYGNKSGSVGGSKRQGFDSPPPACFPLWAQPVEEYGIPQIAFNADDKNNPQRFFAAWDTAGNLLIELAKRTGASKADIEELRREALAKYTNMIKTEKGIPGLINVDMDSAEAAMQDVVDSIFDRVAFRKK